MTTGRARPTGFTLPETRASTTRLAAETRANTTRLARVAEPRG